MNSLEAELDYPFGDSLPATGETSEIAPGLHWVRMPLPFALNHINLWLLADHPSLGHDGRTGHNADTTPTGWCIIDTGIAAETTRDAWQKVFSLHCQQHPILRVIATHYHPDHLGCAEWLCKEWQVPLWMSTGEYGYGRMMSASLPGVDGVATLPHFERHGLSDQNILEAMRTRPNPYHALVPAVPHSYIRLHDEQQFMIGNHLWQVITGFGHSPEHVALYCDKLHVLISGDMVLPRISTNISVFAVEPEANPLKLYLDSLAKFSSLPEDTLVLPSHGKPFRGLATRIKQLRAHHAARLDEVLIACEQEKSAADIVPMMFSRPLDAHQRSFAMGEALAHLHFLWHNGQLCRKQYPNGVIHFQKV